MRSYRSQCEIIEVGESMGKNEEKVRELMGNKRRWRGKSQWGNKWGGRMGESIRNKWGGERVNVKQMKRKWRELMRKYEKEGSRDNKKQRKCCGKRMSLAKKKKEWMNKY